MSSRHPGLSFAIQTPPGLEGALSAVPEDVRVALRESHAALKNLGIPHVLVGGLAVGVHGYAYATRHVDYLVPEGTAFEGTLVVTLRPGVPVRVGTVAIDYLMPPDAPAVVARRMAEVLADASRAPEQISVVPVEVLAWMKLRAGRAKDIAAVVELINAGMDRVWVARFLEEAADSDVLARWKRCVEQAATEA
jgi:hypothetical protein